MWCAKEENNSTTAKHRFKEPSETKNWRVFKTFMGDRYMMLNAEALYSAGRSSLQKSIETQCIL